jgi:hypothetical protein
MKYVKWKIIHVPNVPNHQPGDRIGIQWIVSWGYLMMFAGNNDILILDNVKLWVCRKLGHVGVISVYSQEIKIQNMVIYQWN